MRMCQTQTVRSFDVGVHAARERCHGLPAGSSRLVVAVDTAVLEALEAPDSHSLWVERFAVDNVPQPGATPLVLLMFAPGHPSPSSSSSSLSNAIEPGCDVCLRQ